MNTKENLLNFILLLIWTSQRFWRGALVEKFGCKQKRKLPELPALKCTIIILFLMKIQVVIILNLLASSCIQIFYIICYIKESGKWNKGKCCQNSDVIQSKTERMSKHNLFVSVYVKIQTYGIKKCT